MSKVPLIFQPLVKYADFQGRSRRSEFWLWVLFRYVVDSAAGTIAASIMFSNMGPLLSHPNPSQADMHVFMQSYFNSWVMAAPLISVVSLGLLLPSLAVGVRRLHDIGRTGWWIIMPHVVGFVTMIGFFIFFGTQIFALASKDDNVSDAEGLKFALSLLGSIFLCLIPVMIAWIVMLVFYVTEGKRGPNRFGPDPKGEALNDTP